jgi:hypothetical protein
VMAVRVVACEVDVALMLEASGAALALPRSTCRKI